MNAKNLFLFVMMAGVCSIAHAAANAPANAADIKTIFINTLPGSAEQLAHGPQLTVPIRSKGNNPNGPITNISVWYNLGCFLLEKTGSLRQISLYDENGHQIGHFNGEAYNSDTTYFAASNEPEIDIVGEGGLNIKGDSE